MNYLHRLPQGLRYRMTRRITRTELRVVLGRFVYIMLEHKWVAPHRKVVQEEANNKNFVMPVPLKETRSYTLGFFSSFKAKY